MSPCGFQGVRRDSQRPRSITTVRLQYSAITVARICRANTLMDAVCRTVALRSTARDVKRQDGQAKFPNGQHVRPEMECMDLGLMARN